MAGTTAKLSRTTRRLLTDPSQRKRDQRSKVQRFQHELMPGVWLLSASHVARHWRSRQPPTLARSAHGTKKATSSSRWVRGARRLLYLWGTMLPPWTTRVPRVHGPSPAGNGEETQHRQRHTFLATKPHRTDVLLLDPPRKVLRTQHAAPITPEQREVRTALARHFEVPRFEVRSRGVIVVEEYVVGHPVATLFGSARREAVAEVLKRFASVTRHEGHSNAHDVLVPHLLRARLASHAPQAFKDALAEREQRILGRARFWPLAPAHVSSHANNYLLSDGGVVALDFQNPAYAPFFFDALKLCTTELTKEASRDGRPLLPMIAERYDAELRALYREAREEFTRETLEDSWLAFAAMAMGDGASRWHRWVTAWDPRT